MISSMEQLLKQVQAFMIVMANLFLSVLKLEIPYCSQNLEEIRLSSGNNNCTFIGIPTSLLNLKLDLSIPSFYKYLIIEDVNFIQHLNLFKQLREIQIFAYAMLDETNKEIISFWIGRQSQKTAFNFYNLQAQQMFDEQDDPIQQKSLWNDISKAAPRMMILDFQVDRLAEVRKVNTAKMIEKMQKTQGSNYMDGLYGNIDYSGLQNYNMMTSSEEKGKNSEENTRPEFSNWTDEPNNYFKIDTNYTKVPEVLSSNNSETQFEIFQEFYRRNEQQMDNRIRKMLESSDFLRGFTICADQNYSGYNNKFLEYLRYQCPKKTYFVTTLSNSSAQDSFSLLPFSKLYEESDIFVPIYSSAPKFNFFNSSANPYQQFSPYISSLFTPLFLKGINIHSYVDTIVTDGRKAFNTAYTLPIIDKKQDLLKQTNIFKYEQAFQEQREKTKSEQKLMELKKQKQKQLLKKQKEEKKRKIRQERKEKNKMKEQQEDQDQENDDQPYRINFSNLSYLSMGQGKFISESYIIKGQFNNFQKIFSPKSEPSALSIKYLEGTFSVPESIKIQYDKYYHHYYGQQSAQAFPYHLTLFSHEGFGDSIRKSFQKIKKPKIFHEEWEESREKVLQIADKYKELRDSDSD